MILHVPRSLSALVVFMRAAVRADGGLEGLEAGAVAVGVHEGLPVPGLRRRHGRGSRLPVQLLDPRLLVFLQAVADTSRCNDAEGAVGRSSRLAKLLPRLAGHI